VNGFDSKVLENADVNSAPPSLLSTYENAHIALRGQYRDLRTRRDGKRDGASKSFGEAWKAARSSSGSLGNADGEASRIMD
jgi:hypothetical protein